MQVREKVEKSRFTVFFQWSVAPDLGRWEMKNCTPLWREAHVEVKMYKAPHLRSTFGHGHVKKVHAVVARSMFTKSKPTKNFMFAALLRKSARRCSAKHISKSKCAKHLMFGALLEVEMSKKCTPSWREAHFQVKMCKTHQGRSTFGSWDVEKEKVYAVVARRTFRSQKCENLTFSDHFWTFRCRSAWQGKGMCTLPKVSKTWGFCSSFNYNHHYTTLQLQQQQLQLQLHYTTLRYTNYITLRYTTALHYTTLNYTTLHYTTLHYTTLHYITLQLQLQLHYITLHNTTLYYTTICYSTLR